LKQPLASWIPAFLSAVLLILPCSAAASGGTYTPPMLRGDLQISYQGGVAVVQLEDRSSDDGAYSEVASYKDQEHGMLVRGSFTPYHGIAISLDVPIVFHQQLEWSRGNDFTYDPSTDRATMAGAAALDEAALDASPASVRRFGLGDIGLNFRIVPFAQEGLPNREAPIDLAFDFGLRFPSGQHRHKFRDDGTGYPGQGGMGVTVGASAARRIGPTTPYLSIHYSHNAPFPESDEDGEPAASALEHSAADSFQLKAGAVIDAYVDHKEGRAIHIDISMKAAYISPENRSSGLRLPSTLPDTLGQPSVVSEHVEITGGLSLGISPRPQVEIHMDFDTTWISPHSIERVSNNAYSVRTRSGSLALHWGAGVRIHFR